MRYWRHPNTAGRVVEGQAFVITANDNKMYTLNPTGTLLWDLSAESFSLREAARAIATSFEVDEDTAFLDVKLFVRELVHKQVLVAQKSEDSS